jgi:hypothetical protein
LSWDPEENGRNNNSPATGAHTCGSSRRWRASACWWRLEQLSV